MLMRQLFDAPTSTYTYIIADAETSRAAIIDPVLDQVERDLRLLRELGLRLEYAIDTHIHADHITANGHLRQVTGCRTAVSSVADVSCADIALTDGDRLPLGESAIEVIATPGHTQGCLSLHIEDHVFTGDALFVRGCGRTDFQQGDAGQLYDSITQRLFTLHDATWVHPGHDYHGMTISTIGEEKRFNPRLKLDRAAFIVFMDSLDLPDPRLMMEAVPANESCGQSR